MEKSIDRLKVIDNIEKNIKEKKFNDKVEENDPFMTEEERRELILDFDNLKTKWRNKFKANIARYIVDMITLDANQSTEIIGIENIKDLDSGAIITSNHFSKMDNTVIRYLMHKIGKRKDLFIVVQETNMKMEGEIGWLLKNCYTIPLSSNLDYLQNNFVPTLKKILDNKGFVLIYPEQENSITVRYYSEAENGVRTLIQEETRGISEKEFYQSPTFGDLVRINKYKPDGYETDFEYAAKYVSILSAEIFIFSATS